jgi:type II secretory pathway component PulJ
MFTHRLFNLFVAIALVAVIALTAQAAFSPMKSTYRESKDQAQREYEHRLLSQTLLINERK